MVDEFVENGFIAIRGAVSRSIVAECRAVIDRELIAHGVDPANSETWSKPVVRINCPEGESFAGAGTSPVLWRTYDALLGEACWIRRAGVGGTVPVRFPSEDDPGDAGWHIDGSYDVEGRYWVNVNSRGRGLLALFLFSDVGIRDAPTEIAVGSHLDVPSVLAPFGKKGMFFGDVVGRLPASTFKRPRTDAVGEAGDVYVCHPFLVHRATWPHRGFLPRVIAQPEVAIAEPFRLTGSTGACPVERAILKGLER